MKVYLNGDFLKAEQAKISVFDHGFLYGDGVFETLQFDHGEIFHLKEHLLRLHQSAEAIRLLVPKIDFFTVIKKLIEINGLKKARIRITLTRGENNYNFITCDHPTLLITAAPFIEKRQDFYHGTKCCTIWLERPFPHIKTIQLLPSTLAQQKMFAESADECFFVNHKGEITEGSVSNFFAIKNGTIYTPPLDVCLNGTMRQKIKKLCEEIKIPFIETPLLYNKIESFDEAFWTNAIVGIVPIKQLDSIHFTCPGDMSKKIQLNFVK